MKKQKHSGISLKHSNCRLLFRYLAIILAIILLYSAVAALQARFDMKIDLTPNAITRLSEQTTDLLAQVKDPITIQTVFQPSTASDLRLTLETIIAQYALQNKSITSATIDPITQPNLMVTYQDDAQTAIAQGSVIVSNARNGRFKVVHAREMYSYSPSQKGDYTVTGISIEQKLTSAIAYVIADQMPAVYFLTGHGEVPMDACTMLVTQMQADNYEVSSLELLKGTAPTVGDIVLLLSPTRDLTQEEALMLDSWFTSGVRLFYACDASIDMTALPRFSQLITRYSLSFEAGIVVEASESADYWMNSPMYLVPQVNRQSAVLSSMKQAQRVVLPGARAVSGPQIPLSGYTYHTLLSTSAKAYLKRTDSEAFTQEPQDPTGCYQLAAALEHRNEENGLELRAVFMGSLYTVMDNSLLYSTYNLDLMGKMLSWLSQREESITIPIREIAETTLNIPSASVAWRIFAITLILPFTAMAVGFIVFIRRRRR